MEGNASVKWLRRIELGDQPFMTREETSKYTDPLPDGTALGILVAGLAFHLLRDVEEEKEPRPGKTGVTHDKNGYG